MEMSPEKQDSSEDGDSVLAIARRIAGGLHPRMVYSDSDYLGSTKSELRKLLKQRWVFLLWLSLSLWPTACPAGPGPRLTWTL